MHHNDKHFSRTLIKQIPDTPFTHRSQNDSDSHNGPASFHERFSTFCSKYMRDSKLGACQQLDAAEKPSSKGWRKAMMLATLLTGTVFLLNLCVMLIALLKWNTHDGVGLIYRGDCNVVKNWNSGPHLCINILSTLLLAARQLHNAMSSIANKIRHRSSSSKRACLGYWCSQPTKFAIHQIMEHLCLHMSCAQYTSPSCSVSVHDKMADHSS